MQFAESCRGDNRCSAAIHLMSGITSPLQLIAAISNLDKLSLPRRSYRSQGQFILRRSKDSCLDDEYREDGQFSISIRRKDYPNPGCRRFAPGTLSLRHSFSSTVYQP